MGLELLTVFGTRPEAIKMCPLIKCIERYPQITNTVCITSQHKEMLQQVLDVFQIDPKYDLDIMDRKQTISEITIRILQKLDKVFEAEKPNMVLVHGDTTTCLAATLAAFYKKIPVGHVEAGLRSYDKYSPYPEEINRKLTSQIAEIHFAPTEKNVENLKKEGIEENIYVTGNTVLDSFKYTIQRKYRYSNFILRNVDFSGKRLIIVTAHRRENIGAPLINICNAINRLVSEYRDIVVVFPVHLNPAVREIVVPILSDRERIYLLDPLNVEDMHNLMSQSYLVMTDSGGLQEEAPYFNVPVIVLRKETERTEAVEANTVVIAGTEEEEIINVVHNLLNSKEDYLKMARASNPYGDGFASERIISYLLKWYDKNNQERSMIEGGMSSNV